MACLARAAGIRGLKAIARGLGFALRHGSHLAVAIAGSLLLALGAIRPASALELIAYPEGTRLELASGKVFDGDATPLQSLRFRAARDEVVAFQVYARGTTTRTASISLATPLQGTVFAEHEVRVTIPSASPNITTLGARSYPDILIPTSTITLPGALWIDLHIPRKTKPGLYPGTLRVADTELHFEVEVLDLTLPERDIAKLGAVNFGSLLIMEKRDPQRLRRWMQLAHAHHLTIELMRPMPKGEEWSRFAAYLDGTAFTDGPRAGQPVTRFIVPFAEKTPLSALLEWERTALAKGWLHRTEWILFLNSLDEPKTAAELETLESYGPLLEQAGLLDRRHVTFRVDGVLGPKIEGWPDATKIDRLARVVDLWNLHGAPDTAPINLLAARGERAMFYASISGGEPAIPPLVVDSAIAGARAWAWIVARYHLDGALNWELDYAAGCVINPRCSEGGVLNLDALLIYRGHEVGRATDEPIPSMRLKALRRGAQDVALLELVRAKDSQRAEALARNIIPRALGEARGARGSWPKDHRAYEEARDEMFALLTGTPQQARSSSLLWLAVIAAVFVVWLLRLMIGQLRR